MTNAPQHFLPPGWGKPRRRQKTPLLTKLCHERLVGIAFRAPELVVDVSEDKMGEETLPAQPDQNVRQGDAVGATRDGHDAAGAGQACLLEEATHGFDQHRDSLGVVVHEWDGSGWRLRRQAESREEKMMIVRGSQ